MKNKLHAFGLMALMLLGCPYVLADDASLELELDAYWASVSSYLAAGDFEGLVTTYHPDAVLVSESLGTSYPITRALKRWKPGILDTKAGKAISKTEFRITQRLFSETTSHEKGIVHMRYGPIGGDADEDDLVDAYVHIEGLLLKSGEWTMVMEYQKHPATQAEWDAAQ